MKDIPIAIMIRLIVIDNSDKWNKNRLKKPTEEIILPIIVGFTLPSFEIKNPEIIATKNSINIKGS